jgi:glycosyltransferase involved in cell wall biosynthesis
MEKICLINNYNYAKYLGDSIESALAQTLPFDKIIVIDDGSSDESITIIKRYENNNPSVISILKKNQGQFSCFCAVVDLINEDSQVFFLDSDDIYPKDYLEKIMSEINYQIFDFTYCTAFQFFESNQKPSISSFGKEPSLLSEKTQAHVLKYSIWMGSPTSALSISGKLFKLLASYPHYEDWRIRADDIFVFGTSIIGAKKLYIPSLCVGWRIHGKNASVQNSFWKIKLSPKKRPND